MGKTIPYAMLDASVIISALLEHPSEMHARTASIFSRLEKKEQSAFLRELLQQTSNINAPYAKQMLDVVLDRLSSIYSKKLPQEGTNTIEKLDISRMAFIMHGLTNMIPSWETMNAISNTNTKGALAHYHRFHTEPTHAASMLEEQCKTSTPEENMAFFIDCAHLQYVHQQLTEIENAKEHENWNALLFALAQQYVVIPQSMINDAKFDHEIEHNPLYSAVEYTQTTPWCELLMARLEYALAQPDRKNKLHYVCKMFRSIDELQHVHEFHELSPEQQIEVLLTSNADTAQVCEYAVRKKQIEPLLEQTVTMLENESGYSQVKGSMIANAILNNPHICQHLEKLEFTTKRTIVDILLRKIVAGKNLPANKPRVMFNTLPKTLQKEMSLVSMLNYMPKQTRDNIPVSLLRACSEMYSVCSQLLVHDDNSGEQRSTWCKVVATILDMDQQAVEHTLNIHESMFEHQHVELLYHALNQRAQTLKAESIEWIP